uniref:Uncharacterized protein n=1 Tax=Opuntia streptacantha TaxID=393608 RepID=A0A7C8YV22_OPUST
MITDHSPGSQVRQGEGGRDKTAKRMMSWEAEAPCCCCCCVRPLHTSATALSLAAAAAHEPAQLPSTAYMHTYLHYYVLLIKFTCIQIYIVMLQHLLLHKPPEGHSNENSLSSQAI